MGSPCLFTRQRALKMGYFYWLRVKIDISSIPSFKVYMTHYYLKLLKQCS